MRSAAACCRRCSYSGPFHATGWRFDDLPMWSFVKYLTSQKRAQQYVFYLPITRSVLPRLQLKQLVKRGLGLWKCLSFRCYDEVAGSN